MPVDICYVEPSNCCTLCIQWLTVQTDGRNSKAPQATEKISKRPVNARHRELCRGKVQKKAPRDEGEREILLSNMLAATEQIKTLGKYCQKPSLTS